MKKDSLLVETLQSLVLLFLMLQILMLLTSHALTSISRAVLKLSSVTAQKVMPRIWLLAEQLATLLHVHSILSQLPVVMYLLGLPVRNLRLVVTGMQLDLVLSNFSKLNN